MFEGNRKFRYKINPALTGKKKQRLFKAGSPTLKIISVTGLFEF